MVQGEINNNTAPYFTNPCLTYSLCLMFIQLQVLKSVTCSL